MATQYKRIDISDNRSKDKGTYLTKENWEVMKPFVHFAFKALGVIASAVVVIVKLVPKAFEHQPQERKDDRVIKI